MSTGELIDFKAAKRFLPKRPKKALQRARGHICPLYSGYVARYLANSPPQALPKYLARQLRDELEQVRELLQRAQVRASQSADRLATRDVGVLTGRSLAIHRLLAAWETMARKVEQDWLDAAPGAGERN